MITEKEQARMMTTALVEELTIKGYTSDEALRLLAKRINKMPQYTTDEAIAVLYHQQEFINNFN